ncbi:hypothetical protein BN873_660072 [Candidatus Competibacter denitrificans Run_A_D11]|uniref:Uncharacterized protein n=1 Tax=Candidatus Competibacter denitrificans Run_A_D11 TaxID=1400863 RepID=W6ME18_9GAMM|nr:hypothetical protein BN873_660072 [Candidatus Competibacter denitrificans Run_A_D11]
MLYLLVRGIVLQVAWWPAGYDLTRAWEVAECVMGRYERFWGDKVVGGLARPHGFRRAEPSGVARTWL